MSLITLEFMRRYQAKLETAIQEYVDSKLSGGRSQLFSQNLVAGNTTVTFTGLPTTGINLIDVFTSKAGVDYTDMDDSTSGQVTVTYDVQDADMTVYLKIESFPE